MKYKYKEKILISGSIASGTTLLTLLLHDLGLDIGFNKHERNTSRIKTEGKGLEYFGERLKRRSFRYYRKHKDWDPSPEVIKNPVRFTKEREMLYNIKKVHTIFNFVEDYAWDIKHIFILIRDPYNWYKAVKKTKKWDQLEDINENIYGVVEMMSNTFILVHKTVASDCPFSFLEYPRFALDSEYCFNKLIPVIKDVCYNDFKKKYDKRINTSMITI